MQYSKEFSEYENGKEVGIIYGYTTDEEEIVENFLEANDYFIEDGDVSIDLFKGKTVGIIKSLHVDENHRGNGYGTNLLENMLYFLEGVDIIFLICDNLEHNDFSLQSWYEDYGFHVVLDKFNCPLMIKNC